MGVQFHPEASPGPVDTVFLVDALVNLLLVAGLNLCADLEC